MDKGNAGAVNEIESDLKIVSPGSFLSNTKESPCKSLQIAMHYSFLLFTFSGNFERNAG